MIRRLIVLLSAVGMALGGPPLAEAQEVKTKVRRAATEVLSARYPEGASHLNVRVRRVRGEIDTTKALRVQFSDAEGAPTGLAQVELRLRSADGSWTKAGWALLRVARLDSVVTVQGRVREGEPLPRSKLEVAWIETTDLSGEPLRADKVRTRAERGALVAARYLRSGRVLRRRDVRRPYAIHTGSSIEMHFREGRIMFRMSCKAREPGFVDEVIRVHCPDLDTMYRARITGKDTARWRETL